MAVGHSFRRSGFLCFMLGLLLLYRGITIDLGQPQMCPRLADFYLVLQDNSTASTNLYSITASWAKRHIVSQILRKGFSSSRICYYPNSVASYQIIRLQLSGDVNPNPGPNGSEQHNSTEQQKSTRLLTFYANARSIVNKSSKLDLAIAALGYDIIVLTETHLDSSIPDGEIFPSDFSVFRRDRKLNGRHGGGVLIATRDHIKAVLRDTPQNDSEFIFVDLLFSYNRKVTLGVFYRPPNNDVKPLEDLQAALQEFSTNELILLGDFNLPEIDWLNNRVLRQSDIYTLMMDIVQDNFLTQLINEPTRDSNILDLVLTTSPDLINNLFVGEPFSDHNSISFLLSGTPYVQRKSQKLLYCYGKADWDNLRSLLSYIPWHCAFFDSDINHNWACWKDLLFTAVDECIPKRKNRRKSNAPWITKELIVLCKKKKSLYKRARRSNTATIWEKYRQLNNSVKRLCNTARWSYIKKLALDLQENDNPKPFWNFVKSKRRGTNNLISLNVDGSVLTDDSSIAQSMNSYFSSVFTTEDHVNFPTQDCTFDKKLARIDCSVNEVKRHLLKLKPNKSPGPDHIAPCILKSCALELAPSLTHMINKSFSVGLLPDEWKHADITPLHKKGSKSSRENYRPISLTSIACKIGEKIVFDRMIKFWREIDLINNNQFGFLRGRSTATQLLSTFNDWAKSRNLSTPTDVIFLDLAKAFDSVPHERLLLKLKSNGIDGSLLNWLRHFLVGRKQRVVVRGSCSDWSCVTSGTPQGTILGPLLFLLYINDITECISSTVKLYADDTKIYREIIDPIIDCQILQDDLNNLSEWARKWQLRFNADKCESMRITHSRDRSETNYFLEKPLKDVHNFKDLGVTITKDLSWGNHIGITVNKANKVLGSIKRSVGTADTNVFSMLYKSLVRPILEYAVPVWCPYLVKDIHALENVQRRASRLALNQRKGQMSYEDRCKLLKWPTLSDRRTYLSLIECYKIVFGFYHLKFEDFYDFATTRSTRANHQYKLYVKPARLNCYKHSFFVRTVKLWNELPGDIVEADSFKHFKSKLKMYLNI